MKKEMKVLSSPNRQGRLMSAPTNLLRADQDKHLVSGHAVVEGRDALEAGSGSTARRRSYVSPVLEVFGDIRDVTLGPSPGTGESGAPGMFKP